MSNNFLPPRERVIHLFKVLYYCVKDGEDQIRLTNEGIAKICRLAEPETTLNALYTRGILVAHEERGLACWSINPNWMRQHLFNGPGEDRSNELIGLARIIAGSLS